MEDERKKEIRDIIICLAVSLVLIGIFITAIIVFPPLTKGNETKELIFTLSLIAYFCIAVLAFVFTLRPILIRRALKITKMDSILKDIYNSKQKKQNKIMNLVFKICFAAITIGSVVYSIIHLLGTHFNNFSEFMIYIFKCCGAALAVAGGGSSTHIGDPWVGLTIYIIAVDIFLLIRWLVSLKKPNKVNNFDKRIDEQKKANADIENKEPVDRDKNNF